MPNMSNHVKKFFFCCRTFNLATDFAILLIFSALVTIQNTNVIIFLNVFIPYWDNSNFFVDNTIHVLKFHTFFNNLK